MNSIHYVYTTFSLFIHQFVDLRLAIVNTAALNKGVWISSCDPDFSSFGYRFSSGVVRSWVVLVLSFWGTSILFSIVAAPVCIPNSAKGFLSFTTFDNTSCLLSFWKASQWVKNLLAMQEILGLISRSGRFPGEGNGHQLQYYCLENPMDRGA